MMPEKARRLYSSAPTFYKRQCKTSKNTALKKWVTIPRAENLACAPTATIPAFQGNTSLGRTYACLQTPALMALNFCSAVGIVVANKALFRHAEGLSFATSLTGIHFLATALGVRACRLCDIYKVKPLKQTQVRPCKQSTHRRSL